ncbi:hypothetical protein BDQ12DRAFT_654948 [Crucibulum laeve]|uniref:DUF6534 domain-containing protein n=1 Tax=Crucibulum laeve TaxID=68775 RepID=A0A5C3LW43_9AGAR|nr:hypothetical protein BDQ12DRAFT_654948 [Crucibulum laeve]
MGEYDFSVGVLLIGLFFNTYLYGLVTCQFITYGTTKFNDPLWIRFIVWTLFVTDTAHSIIAIYAGYDMCVTNYGNPASLLLVSWTIPVLAIATAFAAILTQAFLGHRVYVFMKSKILSGILGLLSIVAFIFAVYAGYLAIEVKEVTHFNRLEIPVTCWLVLQTATDLILNGLLIYILARQRTGVQRTDTVLKRLIRGAVQSGLFVTVFAMGDLFSFRFRSATNLYAMFAYPIGRVYTNTLMDTLNTRVNLRAIMDTTIDMDATVSPMLFTLIILLISVSERIPYARSSNERERYTTQIRHQKH